MVAAFCSNLRKLRGARSQAEFAKILGTKQTTYSGWEVGSREPDLAMLCHISETTGKATDELLGIKPMKLPATFEQGRMIDFKKALVRFIKEY